jgi:hypothetical protein
LGVQRRTSLRHQRPQNAAAWSIGFVAKVCGHSGQSTP